MPDFVKRFSYVKKNTSYFTPVIEGLKDVMGDW